MLLKSFTKTKAPGRLFVAYEGAPPDEISSKFDYYDLGLDSFLQTWLEENKDVIPEYLGGLAPECSCPGREERHAKHSHGCHWQWMNRNASRFFRKVAALKAAVPAADAHKARYIVWLDSDCRFVAPLPEHYLQNVLGDVGFFYFRGHRPAIESGVMGFDLSGSGREMIEITAKCFSSKSYRTYDRWDDGFIWTKMVEEHPEIGAVDMVKKHMRQLAHEQRKAYGLLPGRKPSNNVMPMTTINTYVIHAKGSHGSGMNIMR
jgi:hypothetical protein